MDMKVRFQVAVVVAVIILGLVLVVQARWGVPLAWTAGELSIFNLLVDVVAGVFTVWGLYWAASEFAGAQVKPDLRLMIATEPEKGQGFELLTSEVDALIGRDVWAKGGRVSRVLAGLFLENTRPKAAQYIRVVVRVSDVPRPKLDLYRYSGGLTSFRGDGAALFLQFAGDLVVYKGEPVCLIGIELNWPQDAHPERVTFVAELYSLEGEPKEVTISHAIRWIE